VQTARLVILTTENTGGPRNSTERLRLVHTMKAAEAVFEARGMEVHQQADAKMTHA
jgi:hypothetical protein